MKKLLSIITVCFLFPLFIGCKKETTYKSDQLSSIFVINGAVNTSIMLKMNDKLNVSGAQVSVASTVSKVPFGSAAIFSAEAGQTQLDVMKGTDTSILTGKAYDLKKGGIYSLFVAGVLPNVESILVEETSYPYIDLSAIPSEADSIINVRFINLSPDVQPVSIRLQGASTFEVTGLAYKGYTSFKAYPARVTNYSGAIGYSNFNIEILESGTVIKTFSMVVFSPNTRFKNVAILIRGMKTPVAGQPALTVSAVNYFQ